MVKVTYECEKCGEVFETRKEALFCERREPVQGDWKIGDTINIYIKLRCSSEPFEKKRGVIVNSLESEHRNWPVVVVDGITCDGGDIMDSSFKYEYRICYDEVNPEKKIYGTPKVFKIKEELGETDGEEKD